MDVAPDEPVSTDTPADLEDSPGDLKDAREDLSEADATDDSPDVSDAQPDLPTFPAVGTWLRAAPDWSNIKTPRSGGFFTAQFFLKTTKATSRGSAGFGLGRANGGIDLAMSVRLNNQGKFDVRDDDQYSADAQVSYQPNVSYLIEMEIDYVLGTYSVWILPEGSAKVLLKADAKFNTPQASTKALNNFGFQDFSRGLHVGDVQVEQQAVDMELVYPGLWSIDFESSMTGPYEAARIRQEWLGTQWALDHGHADILEQGTNRFLKITYESGRRGPDAASAWFVDFAMANRPSYDDLYMSYRIRFPSNFDWVLGGELPGLTGGSANTSSKPTGQDGWSARMAWRTLGTGYAHLFYPDQSGSFGDYIQWNATGAHASFPKGRWITVENRVVMNTPGQSNGMIQTWFDGELVLNKAGMRFRDVSSFGIDGFYFSTFFGGDSALWHPSKDETIEFDDFIFSDKPLSH